MKRKISIVLISSFFLLAITACGDHKKNVDDTENQSGYDSNNSISDNPHNADTATEDSGNSDKNDDSDNPHNAGTAAENSNDSDKNSDKEINESAKMEILLSRGDDNETYAITETDKISSMYDILKSLTYENAEDVSFNDYSINIYFYDVNDNMTQSYHICEKYLKLNGLPDTYVITNKDFDYDEFQTEVYKLISEATGAKRILPQ